MTTPFVGEIRLFAFPRVPEGWFACDGSLKPISEYETLYTLVGTTYGGDGQSTFAVPDLRGRLPVHQGVGPGLTQRVMGQLIGTEAVTLSSNNLPRHSHAFNATTTNASANVPTNAVLGALTGDTMYTTASTTSIDQMSPQAVTIAGGSGGATLSHDNTMPTLTVAYCIAWAGIFPSQG